MRQQRGMREQDAGAHHSLTQTHEPGEIYTIGPSPQTAPPDVNFVANFVALILGNSQCSEISKPWKFPVEIFQEISAIYKPIGNISNRKFGNSEISYQNRKLRVECQVRGRHAFLERPLSKSEWTTGKPLRRSRNAGGAPHGGKKRWEKKGTHATTTSRSQPRTTTSRASIAGPPCTTCAARSS